MSKGYSLFLLKAMIVLAPSLLCALPEIKEVAAGDAFVSKSDANSLTLKVSEKAIINYKSFNLAPGEQVRFIQPNAASYVLNRVVENNPSSILGSLSSNGKLFLVNPSGVYFGPSAVVDTGALLVSTLDISDADFLAERFRFALGKDAHGSKIVNEGTLSASPEGTIVLLSPVIKNEGVLSAKAGKVALISGEKVAIDFTGDGLLSFTVEGEIEEALIDHLGTIQADQGEVHLRMKAADSIIQKVLNTDGIQEGVQIVKENGVIRLASKSEMIARQIAIEAPGVEIEGKVDASNLHAGNQGGTIHLLGDSVILRGAVVDASGDTGGGTILIGGDYRGEGAVRNSLHVSMDKDSVLLADAKAQGKGGKVILWSDRLQRFDGKIRARGGNAGGDGGFVETSCEGPMAITGHVDTSAPYGSYGMWLVDPPSITVATGGGGSLAQAENCAGGGAVTIDPVTIAAATTHVTLCATSGAPSTITVTDSISIPTSNLGITLQVGGAGAPLINLNNDIITQSGNIEFIGNVTLGGSFSTLNTIASGIGSSVSFNGTINGARPMTVTAGVGGLSVGGIIGGTTAITSLTATANGGITLNGIGGGLAGAGAVNLTASTGTTLNDGTYNASSFTISDGVTIGANTTMTTSGGAISIGGTIDGNLAGRTLSIATAGGAITVGGTIGSTQSLGSLSLNAGAGIISCSSVGNGTFLGSTGGLSFTSTAAGAGIQLQGTNYSTSGGAQTYTGNVTIHQTTSFLSSNSNISFTGTMNGTVPEAETLSFTAGTGSITLSGAVGGTTRLGLINIISANGVTTNGITANSFREMTATGVNSHGAINTSGSGGILLSGTTFSFTGPITTTNSGSFACINTGTMTLPSTAPVTIAGSFTQEGGGSLSLGANITTTSRRIDIAGATTLTGPGPVALDTGTDVGDILFGSTVNGAFPLALTAGDGQVRISGAIGATTPLTSFTVSSAGGGINLDAIGTVGTAGCGATSLTTTSVISLTGSIYNATSHTYNGSIHLKNNVTIQSATNNNISITGTIDGDSGPSRTLSINTGGVGSTGNITLSSSIGTEKSLGGLTLDARAGILTIASVGQGTSPGSTGGMTLSGGGGIQLVGGQYITSGGTQLFSNPTVLNSTTIVNSLGGAITFADTLNGLAVGAQPLSIAAGVGALSFTGAVGNITRLGAITINSAGGVTASSTMNVNSIREQAATGANSFGSITTTAVAGIILLGSTVNLNGLITTAAGGPLNVTNSSTLTLAAAANLDGAFAQTGGGSVSLGANITTNNNPISFANAVTLTAPISLSTGSGIGDISFNGPVNGAFPLTLNAGIGGIRLNQPIGASTALASLAATGNVIDQDSTVQATGSVIYTGNAQLAGNVTTAGGNITITGNVTRDLILNTLLDSNGGNISIGGTINADTAGRNFELDAGTGSITISGVIGSAIPLNDFTATGAAITLEGIGGLNAGIENSLTLTSTGAINYIGTNYVANNQSHTAGTFFNMNAGSGMLFSSLSGPITFTTGQIVLASRSDFLVTTNNTTISFPSLVGTNGENLFFSLGTGTADLGNIGIAGGTDIGNLYATGGAIQFNGPIYTDSFNFNSLGSIQNAAGSVDVVGRTIGVFNALGGNVGLAGSAIRVVDPSYIHVGAMGSADLVGTTVDGTVHCLPSNAPSSLIFNGSAILCAPPTPSNLLAMIPLRDFFALGIFSSEYNLASDFFFKGDLIDEGYMEHGSAPLYSLIHPSSKKKKSSKF